MVTRQAKSRCFAGLAALIMMLGASTPALAGAYDTGAGAGYASCSGAKTVPNGVMIMFSQRPTTDCPGPFAALVQFQSALVFRCALLAIL